MMSSPWGLAVSANVAIGVLGLVTGGLIARMLGPADRGVLAGAILWSGMVFAGCGMPAMQATVVLWSRAASTEARREVLGAALALVLTSAVVALPVLFLLNGWVLRVFDHSDVFTAAAIYLVSLPLTLLAGSIGGCFLAAGQHQMFWGIRVIGAGVYLSVIVAIAVFGVGQNLIGCVSAAAAGTVVSTGWAVARFRRSYPLRPAWNRDTVRELVTFSARSNAAGLPYQLSMRFDQALLALLVPAVVLGQYVVAFTWSSIVTLLGGGVSTVLLVQSAGVGADSEPIKVGGVLARFRLVVLFVTALGVGAALLSPVVVPSIFGAEFRAAVVPAVLLCVATVLLSVTLSLHEIARGLGHPDVGIAAELSALVVAVVVLFILVTPLGGIGAAIASIAGYATALAVLAFRLDRRMDGVILPRLVPSQADLTPLVDHVRRHFDQMRHRGDVRVD